MTDAHALGPRRSRAQGGTAVLATRALSKDFAGIRVLNSVDLEVREGEIHALVGENGAGKSTLIKILAGVYHQDGGTVVASGLTLPPGAAPTHAAFIHQDLGLVPTMTVAENIAFTVGYPQRGQLIAWKRMASWASTILANVQLDVNPSLPLGELSPAEQSLVAIARALAVNPRVLILDEPTAALQADDVAMLFRVLRTLRDEGLAVVFVSHRLDEVFQLCDRVTVLRDGRVEFSGVIESTDPDRLVQSITGELPREFDLPAVQEGRNPILSVRDLTVGNVGPLSFDVHEGEIVALVGLRGAGHELIGRALAGDAPTHRGKLTVNGRTWDAVSVRSALRRGLGFVSGNRYEEGLASGLNVRENLMLNPRRSGPRGRWVGTRGERRHASALLLRYDVRPRHTERLIDTLSGGNQQKVILARWMESGCRLLILEEPTSGVDVGAKAEIYRLSGEMLGLRTAILLVSSDFEEVSRVAHRALVLKGGKCVARLTRPDISIGALTATAAGAGLSPPPKFNGEG